MSGSDQYSDEDVVRLGKQVVADELAALIQVNERMGTSFCTAVRRVLACKTNVVLSGIGKPYFVAQKISASMASTGTPSLALHPVDSLHGDLGRIRDGDVVIALSNSGSSDEMVDFVRACRVVDVYAIAITADGSSRMARSCDLVLDMGPVREACSLGVAPSTSTLSMLALGDALTLTVARVRGFSLDAFAHLHPAGSLGRSLRRVDSALRPLERTATVRPSQTVLEAIGQITSLRCGAAYVVDEGGYLQGVFTDGDLRRLLTRDMALIRDPIEAHMSSNPKRVLGSMLIRDALDVIKAHQVDELPVVTDDGRLCGHLDLQDLA